MSWRLSPINSGLNLVTPIDLIGIYKLRVHCVHLHPKYFEASFFSSRCPIGGKIWYHFYQGVVVFEDWVRSLIMACSVPRWVVCGHVIPTVDLRYSYSVTISRVFTGERRRTKHRRIRYQTSIWNPAFDNYWLFLSHFSLHENRYSNGYMRIWRMTLPNVWQDI